MAMNSMLTQALYLDAQPGGVSPELHLKEGCSSAEVDLLIRNRTLLPNAVSKDFYVRAVRPDGSELFFKGLPLREMYIFSVTFITITFVRWQRLPGNISAASQS